jgi:hypothetical protein
MSLRLVPVAFVDAHAFVADHHLHHRAPAGMKYCVDIATEDGVLRGVANVAHLLGSHRVTGVAPQRPSGEHGVW